MFFFNIFGEEMLWRGYILPRQEAAHGRGAWMVNAALWMLFHLCFGPFLIVILLPILVILPWAASKTGNTSTALLVHGLLNGPMFVLVALGLLG
jgi:membrane protease YdiL (CAAX protease family)